MSNPTTPFSWQMPQNTDLVTDLPADFEVFGQAVATSMQDLLGGTTGQVLKKNTNADMDFVWSADAAGMTNPMTTTGDVIYSSPGSTPVRLGIGTANQILRVNSGATAPEWATPASSNPASGTNYVATQETTTSTSYTNLTTTQAITVTTGTKVLIIVGSAIEQGLNNAAATLMSFEISGATTLAASDDNAAGMLNTASTSNDRYNTFTKASYLTVTAGSNTFTAKFKTDSGNPAKFKFRSIIVMDMGS